MSLAHPVPDGGSWAVCFALLKKKKEKDEGNTQCLRFPFCLATITKARAWRDWDFTGGV